MDRADEAEPFYRRVLGIYQKAYGTQTAPVSSLTKKLNELYPKQPQTTYRPPSLNQQKTTSSEIAISDVTWAKVTRTTAV
jgi:hypothetical protein